MLIGIFTKLKVRNLLTNVIFYCILRSCYVRGENSRTMTIAAQSRSKQRKTKNLYNSERNVDLKLFRRRSMVYFYYIFIRTLYISKVSNKEKIEN